MKSLLLIMFILLLSIIGCAQKMDSEKKNKEVLTIPDGELETATFAGGCFWCMEAPFESIDGVVSVISGYSGGMEKDPSYKEVSSGKTGHYEAIQIKYYPQLVSFSELLDIYWKQFDPTDAGGSFYDRGQQYQSAIFYHNELQKKEAEKSKKKLNKSGIFSQPIATKIVKYSGYHPADDYHQDYYKTNTDHYKKYRKGSGREKFILGIWGDLGLERYNKASDEVLRDKLTKLQYKVTQQKGTERAFDNEYWDNNREGIYVDIVSGEPLFNSKDKFKSGTGWPSFVKPIDPRYMSKIVDNSYNMTRIEVRSNFGDSHLGHIFNDGPEPTNLRYCINSASLKFIPKEEMTDMGYEEFLWYLN